MSAVITRTFFKSFMKSSSIGSNLTQTAEGIKSKQILPFGLSFCQSVKETMSHSATSACKLSSGKKLPPVKGARGTYKLVRSQVHCSTYEPFLYKFFHISSLKAKSNLAFSFLFFFWSVLSFPNLK